MEESEFLKVLNLFSSLDIIEKGIEKIYHFLLINKKIENLKKVCEHFNLSLKRGYKICSVLSDLELVQIYDRPMKVFLHMPMIPTWQKIVNKKIEELKEKFNQKREYCESSLEEFIKNYNLEKEIIQEEPVEFINFNAKDFTDFFYQFMASKECRIAIGIGYENPFLANLSSPIQDVSERFDDLIVDRLIQVKENLEKINIQVILNSDIVRILLKSIEFEIIYEHIGSKDLIFKSIDVRVSEANFSNFSLIDAKFIQPCFSPENKLLGLFVSRNKNIYQIFLQKFNELFNKSVKINDFLKDSPDLGVESLSEGEQYTLCLL